jgi:hypothetical protein
MPELLLLLQRFPWSSLLLYAWAMSFVLSVLLWCTPLEFTPLWLGNLPHWGLWVLALPACTRLRANQRRVRVVWLTISGLLWAPLVLATGISFWQCWHDQEKIRWHNVFHPVEMTFASDYRWAPYKHIAREGRQTVSLESEESGWGGRGLHVTTAYALLPGLRWATHRPLTEAENSRYFPDLVDQ